MVEIDLHPLFEGKLGKTFVVIILLQNDDVRFRKRFDEVAGNGRFPRAGPSANSDDQWPRVQRSDCALLCCCYLLCFFCFFSSITAWAAARRAMGTQNGVALT